MHETPNPRHTTQTQNSTPNNQLNTLNPDTLALHPEPYTLNLRPGRVGGSLGAVTNFDNFTARQRRIILTEAHPTTYSNLK